MKIEILNFHKINDMLVAPRYFGRITNQMIGTKTLSRRSVKLRNFSVLVTDNSGLKFTSSPNDRNHKNDSFDATSSFLRSIQPSPQSNTFTAVFSYAFDTLHFSHVVLDRNTFEILDFSNKRWTLEGSDESCSFYLDNNDRSLENGLGTLKKFSTALLKHMVECTTRNAIPMEKDCIITELYANSFEDKTKKIKDLSIYNTIRGLLYEMMVNRQMDEKRETNCDKVIYEVDRGALNKFYNMKMLSTRRERFLLDEKRARDILKCAPLEPKFPENFFSTACPEVNSQTLIASLLRAVAFAASFNNQYGREGMSPVQNDCQVLS